MMNILVPCGGRYKRFPPGMPKYMRPLNDMVPMFKHALKSVMNYPDSVRVFFAVRKEDEDNVGVSDLIKQYVRDVQVMVLDHETFGPAETVVEMIRNFKITGRFIVKDCDCSMIPSRWPEKNAVYVAWRETATGDRGSKSWITISESGNIQDIKEKGTPTDWYVHGCYQFENPEKFEYAYNCISTVTEEVFCSHVIQRLVSDGERFEYVECEKPYDWGTWEKYVEFRRNRKVYFFDIDGCIVTAGAPYGKRRLWGDILPISGIKEKFLQIKDTGSTIILTTSRPSDMSSETEKLLKDNGILFDRIIYDIPNGPRILINDYDKSNPYPSAEAINTKRDSGDWMEKI